MGSYNGHPSWRAWNVSLWIANDEGLYNLARDAIRETPNRHAAAVYMLEALGGEGSKTPDGAPYTLSNLRHALRGL